jgi:hypothetical protein
MRSANKLARLIGAFLWVPGVAFAHASELSEEVWEKSQIGAISTSASIIYKFETRGLPLPRWCYDSAPTIIISRDQALLKIDIQGTLVQRFDLAYPIANRTLSCSRDGRTISFLNARQDRLVILDESLRTRSEYALRSGDLFSVRYGALMSPDGDAFALPSEPVLVYGRDILREKRVVRVDSGDVFWTKSLLFTRVGRTKSFRTYRLPDFSEAEPVEFPAAWLLNGIFDCSGRYYVSYLEEDEQYFQRFELSQKGTLKIDSTSRYSAVGEAQKDYDACSVSIGTKHADGTYKASEIVVLGDTVRMRVAVPDLGLAPTSFAASKDLRVLLSGQPPLPLGSQNSANLIVLQIRR